MAMVSVNKELSYENMEVLSCHFHLHHHYSYELGIRTSSKRWFENVPWLNVWYSVPASYYIVPRDYRIDGSSVSSTPPWTRLCAGVVVMNNKESTVWKTNPALADRRLFPPEQQHDIVALATKPPQEQGHPITQWSIDDLRRVTIQKGIVSSICPATIWRLLDQMAIKPHRWHY